VRAPVSACASPGAQATHAVWPATSCTVPARQSEHSLRPAVGAAEPGAHSAHWVEPASATAEPFSHCWHIDLPSNNVCVLVNTKFAAQPHARPYLLPAEQSRPRTARSRACQASRQPSLSRRADTPRRRACRASTSLACRRRTQLPRADRCPVAPCQLRKARISQYLHTNNNNNNNNNNNIDYECDTCTHQQLDTKFRRNSAAAASRALGGARQRRFGATLALTARRLTGVVVGRAWHALTTAGRAQHARKRSVFLLLSLCIVKVSCCCEQRVVCVTLVHTRHMPMHRHLQVQQQQYPLCMVYIDHLSK
jgi:hypothetical protein